MVCQSVSIPPTNRVLMCANCDNFSPGRNVDWGACKTHCFNIPCPKDGCDVCPAVRDQKDYCDSFIPKR